MREALLMVWLAVSVSMAEAAAADGTAGQRATLPLKVLLPGELGGDLDAPLGESPNWLALMGFSDGDRLMPTTVRIETIYRWDDPIEGPYTGRLLTSTPWHMPVVLLRGAGLREGPVVAAEGWPVAEALTNAQIKLGRRNYRFGVGESCGRAAPGSDWGMCRWSLSLGDIRQVLHEFRVNMNAEGAFRQRDERTGLIWTGDLDGDRKLDLVVEASDHDSSINHIRVYLSSLAEAGALVGLAGVFDNPGL